MHLRTDRADSPLKSPTRLADGRVVYEGVIAAPGIYIYQRDGRRVRELVTAEVLADPAWLAELPGAPLVIEHPEGADGESVAVTGDNFRDLAVGVNLTTRVGPDGEVIGALSINATEGHDAIRAGKSGLSPRYYAEMDPPEGIWATPRHHPVFGEYDCVQVRRFGTDQIAVCDTPRGGDNTHIRRDSADKAGTMDKEALIAIIQAAGITDDAKVAEVLGVIDAAIRAAADSAGATTADGVPDIAALMARIEALESAPKADATRADSQQARTDSAQARARADTMERELRTIKVRLDKMETAHAATLRADSERSAAEERLSLKAAAEKLGKAVTAESTFQALAVELGVARADSLSAKEARAVVETLAEKAADPRYDGFRQHADTADKAVTVADYD